MFSGQPDAPALALSQQLVDEVLASDVLVIEAPMYNFAIPSVLKAWIDHIVRAGKTFQYGAHGPEGLAKGKKAIIVLGRGGVYSEGPYKVMDYQEPYLRAILGFIGISDVETIHIEGVAMGPDKAAEALEKAKERTHSVTRKAA
jgi:FMN-dependent NADH-azoreductase